MCKASILGRCVWWPSTFNSTRPWCLKSSCCGLPPCGNVRGWLSSDSALANHFYSFFSSLFCLITSNFTSTLCKRSKWAVIFYFVFVKFLFLSNLIIILIVIFTIFFFPILSFNIELVGN
jgi:hypothetical protein